MVISIHQFTTSRIHQFTNYNYGTLKKNWLAWVILGGPVLVYAIGKLLNR